MKKPSPDTPRKAAIYLRISQDREMDGLAIERQREDCERLAEFKRWEVVEPYYIDESISAYSRTAVRKRYDQMVADYEAGLFTAIICWDLDRLTRQPRQLEDWIDAARFKGLALVTANGEADLSKSSGRTFARIKAAVAVQEMEQKALRQSRAQLQRATQGRAPKGVRPLGYTVQGEVIPDEAETVRAIYAAFSRVEKPASLRSIARALSGTNAPEEAIDGITPRSKHSHVVATQRAEARIAEGLQPSPKGIPADGPWSPSTVLGILRNPRYAALSTYTPKVDHEDGNRRRTWKAQILRNDEGEPIRGQWEALVDDETWWRVQQILDDDQRVTNTSGSTKRKHLGSGLYLCWQCNGKVTGAPRGYRCAGHVMRTGAPIDDMVMRGVARRLADDDATEKEPLTEDSPAVASLSAAIGEQRAKITRAERDYDDEIIEARDLKRVRDKAQARIAELEAERLRQGRGDALVGVLGTDDPAQAFLDASLDVRREVIDTLCTVTLFPQPRGRKGFDPNSVLIEFHGDDKTEATEE